MRLAARMSLAENGLGPMETIRRSVTGQVERMA